jgi:hypothetical protein
MRIRRATALLAAIGVLVVSSEVRADAPSAADEGVAGIRFLDAKSTITRIGTDPALTNEHPAFAHARYVNDDSSQALALIFHPGGIALDVAEAIVETAGENPTYPRFPGGAPRFQSARGIHLGMSKSEVTRILGSADSASDHVLEYRITKENGGRWLEERNLPVYFGTYEFRDGKLFRFSFGFEYP